MQSFYKIAIALTIPWLLGLPGQNLLDGLVHVLWVAVHVTIPVGLVPNRRHPSERNK
ncbi:MAG TPA: hypothetical protein VMF06_15840 [Candidatus Limnocylindria bacterium]|jgi:hypothetical protein|nr:hypothetical protein [Candidatus Limnocylindria bacterium]